MPFSPLADSALPPCDGVYIGGGFPELFARDLAANRGVMADLAIAAARGLPVYAECGGLMYLSAGITDLDGHRHAMAGLAPGWSSMPGERLSLGYATVTARGDNLLLPAGASTRGHEFHWSRIDRVDADTAAWDITEQPGRPEGYALGSVLASYIHLHFGANPALAPALVAACARHRSGATAG